MQLPKGKNLYDILDLTKKQVEEDESLVKKAYRKLALKYHPDKQTSTSAQQSEQATQQFLLVGYAYSILGDSAKRNHYDITGGSHDIDAFFSGGKDWTNYFKNQWQGVVSAETVDAHSLKYQGSTEEEEHVLRYYTEFKGNMNHILAHVEHSKASDVPRFMDLIQAAIQNNEVDTFAAYAKTTSKAAQMRRLKREEEEAARTEEEARKKKSKDNKGKQQQDDPGNTSDELDSSIAEEETDEDEDGDDEDLTFESLEDMINARQQQRTSNFNEMLTAMENAANEKERTAKHQGVINKRKGKGRAAAIDNNDDDSLSTIFCEGAPSESSTSAPTSLSTSVSTSSNNKKENDAGVKKYQTTITTRSMTKKHTKQTRTKTTTADTDANATTTTTSVICKSKKLTKVDLKKRKRGGDQGDNDDNDKANPDDSVVAKERKAKKVSTCKDGKIDLIKKPSQHTRPQRRKSTKKTKSSIQ